MRRRLFSEETLGILAKSTCPCRGCALWRDQMDIEEPSKQLLDMLAEAMPVAG